MLGLVLFCVMCWLYALALWRLRAKRTREVLPPLYSGALPLIGHTHLLIGDSTQLWRLVQSTAHESIDKGGVIRCTFGFQTYYIITDPDDALTASNACLQKHFAYDFAKPWLGDGLITGSGPVWKRHRKLLNPAFGLNILHSFSGVFNRQARKLVSDLAAELGKGPTDLSPYLKKMSLETISQTAFGITSEEDPIFYKKYTLAVDEILNIIVQRFQNGWLQSDFIYKLVGLKSREQKLIKTLNSMSDVVIKKKKRVLKNKSSRDVELKEQKTGIRWKAFLDLLLELLDDDILTEKEIREEVDTTIVAAFDTTTWLLTYTLLMLGSHHEIQDRVYDELQQVFGNTDKDIEKGDLLKLVYTEAVIKETLRLYPIIPVSARYVEEDVKLKNFTMRAGSQCVLHLYGTQRHPAWGADAHLFRPERWLDSATLPDHHVFAGFSIGKRACLGKTYAMLSMKTALSHVLKHYRITADVSKLKLKMDFVLKPLTGHLIGIERRH